MEMGTGGHSVGTHIAEELAFSYIYSLIKACGNAAHMGIFAHNAAAVVDYDSVADAAVAIAFIVTGIGVAKASCLAGNSASVSAEVGAAGIYFINGACFCGINIRFGIVFSVIADINCLMSV